jgi:hypothetical protein
MNLNRLKQLRIGNARVLAGLFLAGSILFGMNLPGLQAAQGESAGAVPRVALSELGGTPGASLMMPLYFTPDPKTPLKSMSVDIEFTSNNLKFQKSSLGVAAEQANADIQTSVTEGQPDANGRVRSKLHVTASLTGPTPKEGLPDGLLAYLLFQISLDAKPFSIQLVPTVLSAETMGNPPKKVTNVATEPGKVNVEVLDVMPEGTCFFFSH